MHRLLSLLLIATLTLGALQTGLATAWASDSATRLTICAGGTTTEILISPDGTEVPQLHACPDCLLPAMALPADHRLPQRVLTALSAQSTSCATRARALHRPAPSQRGPPKTS